MVIFITVLGQALIVQFGSVVFAIDPKGLNAANWGISILLGTGSVVVGFLIRLLPAVEFPLWLLGGQEVDPVAAIVEVAAAKPLEREASRSSQQLWHDAISKTRMQVRVVKVFTLPKDKSSIEPSARASSVNAPNNAGDIAQDRQPGTAPEPPRTAENNWQKLKMYILTSASFRSTRRDPSSVQMVDPRRVKDAQISRAKQRSTTKK